MLAIISFLAQSGTAHALDSDIPHTFQLVPAAPAPPAWSCASRCGAHDITKCVYACGRQRSPSFSLMPRTMGTSNGCGTLTVFKLKSNIACTCACKASSCDSEPVRLMHNIWVANPVARCRRSSWPLWWSPVTLLTMLRTRQRRMRASAARRRTSAGGLRRWTLTTMVRQQCPLHARLRDPLSLGVSTELGRARPGCDIFLSNAWASEPHLCSLHGQAGGSTPLVT